MMRTILFCPWFGPFPSYWATFVERIKAAGDVLTLFVPTDQVQAIETDANVFYSPHTFGSFATLAGAKLGLPLTADLFTRRGGYKACDLRPAFGEIFEPHGYDWWGWCDPDIVPGRWADVLERAEGADIYSTATNIINGPLTLLRNTPLVRGLFRRHEEWAGLIRNPDYRAFDEIGFTAVVRGAGDVNFRSEYAHSHSGMDKRSVEAPGIALCPDGRLIDTIQEREVLFFHFPHWKQWPRIPLADGRWHPAERVTGAPAKVLPLVWQKLLPNSVVDFGCNVGEWTAAAAERGAEIMGVDGAHHSGRLMFPRERFVSADLREPLDLGRRFDLALCLEVAEHLPDASADRLVATIVAHADAVLWSAAIPGQGGYMHINCRPPEYWAAKFQAHGYYADRETSAAFRSLPVPSYYAANLFLYRKAAR